MKEKIFISYNSKEFGEAMWLKGVLEKNGLSCWMAPQSIPGGSNYAKEIPKAIKECRIFVILLSKKAQESIWVSKEIDLALSAGKVIMPYMIESCQLMDQFDFYLSDVQRYEAFMNRSMAIKKMVQEIRAILGISQSEVVIDTDVVEDVDERAVDNDNGSTKEKSKGFMRIFDDKKYLPLWILLTYICCIPAGVVVTLSYIYYAVCDNARKKEICRKVTVALSVLGILVGIGIFIFALGNSSACDEAFFFSVLGWFRTAWAEF